VDANTAISLGSASVALAALFIAIWNVVATRHHNRLSVRPSLSFSRKISPISPQLTISVRNSGLGTAIIYKIQVYVDDVEQPLTCATQWQDIIAKLRIFGGMITGYAMQDKETLRPGEILSLVSIEDPDKPYDTREIVAEATRLKIIISYSSMYDEQFTEILGR
jgi:hypothetical protein